MVDNKQGAWCIFHCNLSKSQLALLSFIQMQKVSFRIHMHLTWITAQEASERTVVTQLTPLH